MRRILKRIVISRVDNLGDVLLTLPVAGVLKELLPSCTVIFLGKGYTKPLIDVCRHIDEFADWDRIGILPAVRRVSAFRELQADIMIHVFPKKEIAGIAERAEIPERIGTTRRIYHHTTCNRLVKLSRRKSELHEAQLNLKLLIPLGARDQYRLDEIPLYYGLSPNSTLPGGLSELIDPDRFNLILHPKSKGSAREWGLENYTRLIVLLPEKRYNIFVTGTDDEGMQMKEFLSSHQNRVTDLTGRLSLQELIAFIARCNGIVAASTGPLHIAAALGKKAIGLYAPMHPIHPGRWAPLGVNAEFLVLDKECDDCRKSRDCRCIRSITAEMVAERLQRKGILICPITKISFQ
ncbi:MAG: glycosyltransferase family 9 protein [Bacteroidetes bacterium]|nr:glycosyltransferase family 9 protein [Bacteroidota bacterium]